MRIAIFFSGRIKGYENCLQHLLMYKENYDTTYFCSLNQKESDSYTETFFSALDIKEDQKNIEETVYPPWIEDFDHSQMRIHEVANMNRNRFNTYSMFYHHSKAFLKIHEYQEKRNMQFDIVVQYRADLISKTFIHLEVPLKDHVYTWDNRHTNPDAFCKIGNGMMYGNFDSMMKFTSAIFYMEDMCRKGVVYHPEYMHWVWINSVGLKIRLFDFEHTYDSSRHDPI